VWKVQYQQNLLDPVFQENLPQRIQRINRQDLEKVHILPHVFQNTFLARVECQKSVQTQEQSELDVIEVSNDKTEKSTSLKRKRCLGNTQLIIESRKVSLLISTGKPDTIEDDLLVEELTELLVDLFAEEEPERECEVEVIILEQQELEQLLAHGLAQKREDS